MRQKKPYQFHDDEFIRETIKMIESSNKSVAAIGRDLGISPSTIWLAKKEG